jgi:hypothetical protein
MLFRCEGVTDVSSLGNVHKLTLSYCVNIRDVSALGNVHTLDLTYYQKVTDISALVDVHSLTIQAFQGTDLSGLRNVVILDISESPNVSDISCLKNVQSLNISKCPEIHDFTGLHRLKELIAFHPLVVKRGMEIIQQLQALRIGEGSFLDSSMIFYCKRKRSKVSNISISELRNLTTLELRSCIMLSELPSTLTHIRSLTIQDVMISFPFPGYHHRWVT